MVFCQHRKKNDLLTAKGDFDGDKKTDTAKILVKESGKGIGVWVWLTTQKEPILADTAEHEEGKHDMGIGTVIHTTQLAFIQDLEVAKCTLSNGRT